MKRIGILLALLALSACMVWAQDNSSNSAQNTTQQNNDARKNAAANEANAAENAKQDAKDANTQEAAEHDKAMARLDDAAKDLNQLLAAPDNGIPNSVFTKTKCVGVVPSMIKGGFIFGAEHGRGVASCRLPRGGWSAPAFFVVTGGSWARRLALKASTW